MSNSTQHPAIVDAEIIEEIDVRHLTDDIDRVAIERYPGGDLVGRPGRDCVDEDLPFDREIISEGVDLTDYPEVCAYVRENAERADGPIDFEPLPTYDSQSSGFEPW